MDETEGSLISYGECVNEVNQNVGAKYFSAYIHLLPTFFYYYIRGDELQQPLEQNSTAPIIISSQTYYIFQGSLISYRELSYIK